MTAADLAPMVDALRAIADRLEDLELEPGRRSLRLVREDERLEGLIGQPIVALYETDSSVIAVGSGRKRWMLEWFNPLVVGLVEAQGKHRVIERSRLRSIDGHASR